ncbi:MAG: hypothetical protein ACYCX2_01975 [Christensenellales bacterium]
MRQAEWQKAAGTQAESRAIKGMKGAAGAGNDWTGGRRSAGKKADET